MGDSEQLWFLFQEQEVRMLQQDKVHWKEEYDMHKFGAVVHPQLGESWSCSLGFFWWKSTFMWPQELASLC